MASRRARVAARAATRRAFTRSARARAARRRSNALPRLALASLARSRPRHPTTPRTVKRTNLDLARKSEEDLRPRPRPDRARSLLAGAPASAASVTRHIALPLASTASGANRGRTSRFSTRYPESDRRAAARSSGTSARRSGSSPPGPRISRACPEYRRRRAGRSTPHYTAQAARRSLPRAAPFCPSGPTPPRGELPAHATQNVVDGQGSRACGNRWQRPYSLFLRDRRDALDALERVQRATRKKNRANYLDAARVLTQKERFVDTYARTAGMPACGL